MLSESFNHFNHGGSNDYFFASRLVDAFYLTIFLQQKGLEYSEYVNVVLLPIIAKELVLQGLHRDNESES